jgi:GNAT superfamily N-acetyltransferase
MADGAADGGVEIRDGDADDLLDVMRVIDGSLLDIDADEVRERLDEGDVLVAETSAVRVVGALVLRGSHVAAVAVARTRRGRGIGSALIEAAARRNPRLTADFDPGVRPFYESLGFDVEERDGRLWGER